MISLLIGLCELVQPSYTVTAVGATAATRADVPSAEDDILQGVVSD